MLKYYYNNSADQEITKIDELEQGSWIFGYDIDAEEIQKLLSLGFDGDIIDDALDYYEVPRFEAEKGINYLFTRYLVHAKDGELATAPLLIAISETAILTVSHAKPEFLDHFAHNRKSFVTSDKITTVFVMLETLIEQYEKSLIHIRRTILKYYGNIQHINEFDIKQIVALEDRLAGYLSALTPTLDALNTMVRRSENINLKDTDIQILEDLRQDVHQAISSTKNASKTVQNIRSAHSDILAHKLNNTMKTLTMVTILLTVPTIISSVFGMNTWLPFGDNASAFFIVLGIIIALSWVLYQYFKKNQWL